VNLLTLVAADRGYSCGAPGKFGIEDDTMSTRRMAYWWLRFVISGRFIEKFLSLRRAGR
jgi:hypothetical protein